MCPVDQWGAQTLLSVSYQRSNAWSPARSNMSVGIQGVVGTALPQFGIFEVVGFGAVLAVHLLGIWVCGRFQASRALPTQTTSSTTASSSSGKSPSKPGGKHTTIRIPEGAELQKSPRPQKKAKLRRSEEGPVVMSVYLYSREAADFLPAAGPGLPLYACIFSHEAYPSVCYGVLDRLARFLANTAAAGNPGNIAALRESGVFLVLTKNVDPDHMGYVAYRPVFYVVGDVNNFLSLFDEFLAYAAEERGADRELYIYRC